MPDIHPTAIVDDKARLADDVRVGPFSVVGPQVKLDAGVVIEAHVAIAGDTHIGANTHIFPFASLGYAPQDLKFAGEESRLFVGADCTIREHVTLNPGTQGGTLETRVGDRCLLMVGSHVAHDCLIGNEVILANNATLAGHVTIDDRAILGGLSAVHQFVRIGEGAFIGGMSGVENDVIPFGSALGNRASLGGLNLVGLKRSGVPRQDIHALRAAYKELFDESAPVLERAEQIAQAYQGQILVEKMVAFVRAGSERALCTPRRAPHARKRSCD